MSFIIIPFIASLILIVIYDKLESIPSVKKANYQPWSPPPTPGSHSPTSTTATETSDNSSQPIPLFSVSDKQQSTPVHSIHLPHRHHFHVAEHSDEDEERHDGIQGYEYDDYIWGYENGFADGIDSAEQDIEEARQSGYEQGIEDGYDSADDDDYDDYDD